MPRSVQRGDNGAGYGRALAVPTETSEADAIAGVRARDATGLEAEPGDIASGD